MTIEKHKRGTKDLVKVAVSGWLGTTPEFMDLQLYSPGAALVLHEIFFPESLTAMVLTLAMGTYGAGYAARTVGAPIFGRMGDRIGRKKVLSITITMMEICTTLVGVLPIYAQIGVFAPTLLVTLHTTQGLGTNAGTSDAGTMLAEYVPKDKRRITSSFVVMGTNCGALSATAVWAFMSFILNKEGLLMWGWRIPFLASVVVMVFAIWLRTNPKESPVPERVNDSNQSIARLASAGSMFQNRFFWLTTGPRFGQAGNSGLIQTLPVDCLVQTLLFNRVIPTDALMTSSTLGFMATPFFGQLFDEISCQIPHIIMNTSVIALAWPMLSIIVDKSCAPSTIMVTLTVTHNCAVLGLFALESIAIAEMSGCKGRFIRMVISKEIGGLIASGLGPILAGTFCIMTESQYPIAIMIMAYSVIGLIPVLKTPEVKNHDLSALKDTTGNQPYVVRVVQPPRSL